MQMAVDEERKKKRTPPYWVINNAKTRQAVYLFLTQKGVHTI